MELSKDELKSTFLLRLAALVEGLYPARRDDALRYLSELYLEETGETKEFTDNELIMTSLMISQFKKDAIADILKQIGQKAVEKLELLEDKENEQVIDPAE